MTGRVIVLLLGLGGTAAAQFNNNSANNQSIGVHSVRVQVVSSSGGSCDSSLRVELVSNSQGTVAQGAIDPTCSVLFPDIPVGAYYLRIGGVETSNIVVSPYDLGMMDVTVNSPGPLQQEGRPASVDVRDLQVPARAAKEFTKANQLIAKREWKEAMARLQKAITIYPLYAAAYNGLGIVYARLGDRGHEREALQKAISLNERYGDAHLNLGRMSLATEDYREAETQFSKALALQPDDVVSMVLLTYAQFGNHRYDEAIATSKRVHAIAKVPHAGAHWVAALAFEQKHQLSTAAAEFDVFLGEEPKGDRADLVRKEIVNIRDYLTANPGGDPAPVLHNNSSNPATMAGQP